MESKEIQNAKRMLFILKLNEWLWLAFVAISIGCTVYMLINGDRKASWYFLALIFLSGFFYAFKRKRRQKHEKYIQELQGKK